MSSISAEAAIHALPSRHDEVFKTSPLRLAAVDGVAIEKAVPPSDELVERRKYKGKLAIEALQARFDAITELAEGIDGQMRSEIELRLVGNDFIGPDGRSLKETADRGLETARAEAAENPNLAFEVDRRIAEREEIDFVLDQFTTGRANTIVITSDYPHAIDDGRKCKYYNDRRRQAIKRIWMRNPDSGAFKMVNQTLDRSNRQALEATDNDLGFKTAEGEMLSQRRALTLTRSQQEQLPNRQTYVYDRSMAEQYGDHFYAGRRPMDYRNTVNFAKQQEDLISLIVEAQLNHNMSDEFVYDIIATANARFEKDVSKRDRQSVTSVLTASGIETNFNHSSYSRSAVVWEVKNEGRLARKAGKTFYACGSTYSSSIEDASVGFTVESSLGGGKAWHGGKIHRNQKCRQCHESKSEVGACYICKDCVDNPKKHRSSGSKTSQKKVSYLGPPASNYTRRVKLSGHSTNSKARKSYN